VFELLLDIGRRFRFTGQAAISLFDFVRWYKCKPLSGSCTGLDLSTADHINHNDDDRNDQKNMDEAADGGGGNEAQKP
jgi:hypothetical protein